MVRCSPWRFGRQEVISNCFIIFDPFQSHLFHVGSQPIADINHEYNIYDKYMQFGERERLCSTTDCQTSCCSSGRIYRYPEVHRLDKETSGREPPSLWVPGRFASSLNFTRQPPRRVIPESDSIKATLPVVIVPPKGNQYGASASETLFRVLSNALRGLGNTAASLLGIGFFVRAV